MNGWDFNGVNTNGWDFNGVNMNGWDFNGVTMNGWDLNGVNMNGYIWWEGANMLVNNRDVGSLLGVTYLWIAVSVNRLLIRTPPLSAEVFRDKSFETVCTLFTTL